VESPVENEDFLIRIRPTFSKGGEWTGDAQVSVVTSRDNELTDEVFHGMELFVMMLLASLPVMEQDEYVRDQIYKYVENNSEEFWTDNDPMHDEEEDMVIVERDEDNIIRLTFTTKTKGEA